MGSVPRERTITQSPEAIEIDGKFYRTCGEGRKQHRPGSMDCGEVLELTPENWPSNAGYSDGYSIVCLKCTRKQAERYKDAVAGALVPVRVDSHVPFGNEGEIRGAWLEEEGADTAHVVEVPYLSVIEGCRYWSLDSQGQIQRIQDDPVLSIGLRVCKMHTHSGALQPVYVLRYNLVPLWLAKVETSRMRNKERAAQLIEYQHVCGQVLADYFFQTQTAPPPPAARIPEEGTIVGGDAGVMRYFETAMAPIYERLGILPHIATMTQQTLNLAERLRGIKSIETEIEIEIEVRGVVYFCEFPRIDWDLPLCEDMYADGYTLCAIGWTAKLDVAERLAEYRGKYPLKVPTEFHVIKTDNKDLEKLLQNRRPIDQSIIGPIKGTRDLFWMKPSAIALAKALPMRLSHEKANKRLHRWELVNKGSDIKW